MQCNGGGLERGVQPENKMQCSQKRAWSHCHIDGARQTGCLLSCRVCAVSAGGFSRVPSRVYIGTPTHVHQNLLCRRLQPKHAHSNVRGCVCSVLGARPVKTSRQCNDVVLHSAFKRMCIADYASAACATVGNLVSGRVTDWTCAHTCLVGHM